MVRAGKYRHKVLIYKENTSATADSSGHVDLSATASRTLVGSRKCFIKPMGGGETYRNLQMEADVTHVVEMRSDSLTQTIHPRMWLLYGTRQLNIDRVIEVNEGEVELLLVCKENA